MNNTPRTDAAAWPAEWVEASFARQLETELNEARKHLKDANRGAEINAHALRINADKLAAVTEQVHTLSSEVHTLSSEVHTLGEQRDEYKLVLQSYDCHNHEIATKLEIAREQLNEARDTIAMLTNTLRNNNDAARAGYEELKAELAAVACSPS